MEVLRSIAAGKTNKEIAHELFICVRTIDTHVSNILEETGTTNLTEAASYANRHGLV